MKGPAALCLLLATLGVGCGGVTLFDVTRRQVLDCDIRPSGEFCGDPAGPVQQVIALEHRGEHTVLYFDEETWVAAGTQDERTVQKIDESTREPGPCTTTLTRTLTFDEDRASLSANLELISRLIGPAACGETPRGERKVFSLTGFATDRV
jgi:hypothetical protein